MVRRSPSSLTYSSPGAPPTPGHMGYCGCWLGAQLSGLPIWSNGHTSTPSASNSVRKSSLVPQVPTFQGQSSLAYQSLKLGLLGWSSFGSYSAPVTVRRAIRQVQQLLAMGLRVSHGPRFEPRGRSSLPSAYMAHQSAA
eukprot:1872670-Prymnesium_polylepis.2